MSEAVLECRNLKKNYRKQTVLKGIDMTLEEGKIYGLIGRNGAGKTTLLSILSAQNPATEGEVRLDGEKVWENREALGKICFSRELINNPSGMGVSAYRVKDYLKIASAFLPDWDQDMAEGLIRKFNLNPKKRINKLSKGMTSMITIIVALASKAKFTLLDEPVSGLDVVAREQFYQLLLEEYTNTGRTFVISTHIIEEAADIFEEVIIMDKGEILLKENTQELLARCFHVSGRKDQVEKALEGYETYQEELVGRSKSAMVLLKPGQYPPKEEGLMVQPMNLQKVFVGLCKEEMSDE